MPIVLPIVLGQGSWAGPAWFWLGGPRVLARAGLGLAWGAKGPGPGRLGFGLGGQGSWAGPFSRSTIFNCFQFKKSEPHLDYDCIFAMFLNFPQIGFASIRNLMSSFGEVYDPFCTVFLGASFICFSIFSKFGTRFFSFFRFQTQENRFWGPVTFLRVCDVQNVTVLFTTLQILYKFALILCISFSYVCSRQYGISPFFKTILKYSK